MMTPKNVNKPELQEKRDTDKTYRQLETVVPQDNECETDLDYEEETEQNDHTICGEDTQESESEWENQEMMARLQLNTEESDKDMEQTEGRNLRKRQVKQGEYKQRNTGKQTTEPTPSTKDTPKEQAIACRPKKRQYCGGKNTKCICRPQKWRQYCRKPKTEKRNSNPQGSN